MKVQVRLFGYYQLTLGKMYETIELNEEANLNDLWNHFRNRYVQLKSEDMKRIAGMAVNGMYVKKKSWKTHTLRDGDRVDLLSHMAGG
jgi:thiamine biosynthesis protein ThiS